MAIPISNKVLAQIVEKTNSSTGMYTQEVYKDTLRYLINVFSNVYYIDRNNNSVKIKCFHGNQERAIAKSTVGDNITLPVITIVETTTANNDQRRRYSPILAHETYWDKKKQRAIRLLSMPPRPVDISYEVNIWTKYKQDMDQIREYIFALFNPDLEIETKHGYTNKAFILSESNTEQAEATDTQDRVLKKSITLTAETYIPNPKFLYTSTGKIEIFNYEIDLDET